MSGTKQQKLVIVADNFNELNKALEEGWIVAHITKMGESVLPHVQYILEKDQESELTFIGVPVSKINEFTDNPLMKNLQKLYADHKYGLGVNKETT